MDWTEEDRRRVDGQLEAILAASATDWQEENRLRIERDREEMRRFQERNQARIERDERESRRFDERCRQRQREAWARIVVFGLPIAFVLYKILTMKVIVPPGF
jgi:hypothetical protein